MKMTIITALTLLLESFGLNIVHFSYVDFSKSQDNEVHF